MIRIFAVGVALATTLAGCGILNAPTSQDATPDPVLPSISNPEPIPDGVVATGTLTAVNGDDVGEVRVVKDGYLYRLELPEVASLDPQRVTMPVLSDSPFEVTECGDANIWQLGFGDAATAEHGIEANAFPSSDWSFLTALLIIGYPNDEVGADAAGCTQPILATAPLTWDQPNVRPGLVPVDAGPTSGAMGTVDGTLYTTAPGDVWDEIAARFGIGRDDLEWLNPIRVPGQSHTAYEGQLLNLDPSGRSDSESRRPQ